MVYGYLRVSTIDQDNEKFKTEILHYANERKLGSVKWIDEKISGAKDWKNRELGRLVERLKKSDVIIVPELSRLARSVSQIYQILEAVRVKGGVLHILKQNIIIDGTAELSLTTKVMLNTFSLVDELTRDFIRLRTKEALMVKKNKGVKLGRQEGSGLKLEGRDDEIKKYFNLGMSVALTARVMGVNRGTLISYIKRNKELQKIKG
jgi:DNA invertase Pin-like site-specific DNA recombinase